MHYRWGSAAGLLISIATVMSATGRTSCGEREMMRLLTSNQCPGCNLRGADLVHANLRGANLVGAVLIGANLSRADLSGADLRNTDLSQASLYGANLSDSKLTGSKMSGADLREADLSGAQLTRQHSTSKHDKSLSLNISETAIKSINAHNEGFAAYQRSQLALAESYFSEAVRIDPNQAQSWIARSIVRTRLGEYDGAKADLGEALRITQNAQNTEGSTSIKKAMIELDQRTKPGSKGGKKNELMGAVGGIVGILAPLAMKALSSGLF